MVGTKNGGWRFRSAAVWDIAKRSVVASYVAYIYTSVLLHYVSVCRFYIQWTGTVSKTIKPERDLDLNNSKDTGVNVSLGTLWSCTPQFTSAQIMILFCIRYLMNALRVLLILFGIIFPGFGFLSSTWRWTFPIQYVLYLVYTRIWQASLMYLECPKELILPANLMTPSEIACFWLAWIDVLCSTLQW